MNIANYSFVVFDFEATYDKFVGIHEIIEIGALKFNGKNFDIIAEFKTLVKPSSNIIRAIVDKTGITDGLVLGAPKITEVWDAFYTFCENTILVGHKVSFDKSVIDKTSGKLNLKPFVNTYLDTYVLIKLLTPNETSYSLEDISYKLFNFQFKSHRATEDAKATYLLFKYILSELDAKYKINTLSDIQKFVESNGSLQRSLF